MARTSSLLQTIFDLQVCSVQTAELFTSFEAQKIDKFMETLVSATALHSEHLIRRQGACAQIFEILSDSSLFPIKTGLIIDWVIKIQAMLE
jgi:hypothetical protein